jgi:hypothetical protein
VLTSAAVCPHRPLLLPESAAPELDGLRGPSRTTRRRSRRAEGFDAGMARVLAGADTEAPTGLDATVAAELRAAGRAPWQVLAGAARGGRFTGELLADEAPYGVGHLVASRVRA